MLKVVIADDEGKICQLLQLIVDWHALGYEIVAVAHDGLEALEYVRKYEPDLIITDIQMPECNGLELLHCIRKERQNIDILIISGYREFEYAHQALQEGVEDYLLKPIKRAELETSLRNIQSRRQLQSTKKEELETIEKTLAQSVDKLQSSLIQKIAAGQITHMTRGQLKQEYHCGFDGSSLLFATIRVGLEDPVQRKTEEVIGRKLQMTVRNGLRDAGIAACCDALTEFDILVLVNMKEGQDLEHCFYRLIYSIKDFMGKMMPCHVVVGISKVLDDDLYEAFSRSQLAAMDQVFRGTDRIIEYKKPDYDVETSFFVNDRSAFEIRRGLTTLSPDVIAGIAAQIIGQMRSGARPVQSGANVFHILKALYQQVVSVSQMICANDEIDALLASYEHRLQACFQWAEYEKLFRDMATDLTDLLTRQREQRENKPISYARSIIRERFREQLTLDQISSELELSPAYLSAMFKKETGITISQYITDFRIEEAKRLLITTNDPIARIAEVVGYHDVKYFSRIFKSTVGLKASEYRRLYG